MLLALSGRVSSGPNDTFEASGGWGAWGRQAFFLTCDRWRYWFRFQIEQRKPAILVRTRPWIDACVRELRQRTAQAPTPPALLGSAMPPATGALGRCDMRGGYKQGNGKGYCANSRSRPLICAGDSGQTCLLCGVLKGGRKGCWARGCRAPTTPAEELEVRNRSSNVRPKHRKKAQEEEAELCAELAAERRAWEAAAVRSGPLRTCLRGPGLGPAKQVSWRLTGPAPYSKQLTTKPLPAPVRAFLFWEAPGRTADCDACGSLCALYTEGGFAPVPGLSRFALSEILCAKCAQDSQSRCQKYFKS